MKKSDSIAELAKALSAFQGEVSQPMKDKENPFFRSKYVPLENVVEAITETASKHGLSFMQFPINLDDKVGVITLLLHSSGEYIETEPIFAKPGKNDAQGVGSVTTYLRRYSLSSVFGITSENDDDGNEASKPDQAAPPKQPYKKAPPAQPSGPRLASPAQRSAIGAKTKAIGIEQDKPQVDVYKDAQTALGINKATGELTSGEASKFIEYLITQE